MINGFTAVKNEILTNNKLSVGARTLYSIIASYCYADKNYCFPSQDRLAKDCGKKSTRTIQRYLKELIQANIIKVTRRGHKTNIYTLLQKVIINKAVTKVKESIAKAKNTYNNKKYNKFNDYDQREYDWNELEKKLLGWT